MEDVVFDPDPDQTLGQILHNSPRQFTNTVRGLSNLGAQNELKFNALVQICALRRSSARFGRHVLGFRGDRVSLRMMPPEQMPDPHQPQAVYFVNMNRPHCGTGGADNNIIHVYRVQRNGSPSEQPNPLPIPKIVTIS